MTTFKILKFQAFKKIYKIELLFIFKLFLILEYYYLYSDIQLKRFIYNARNGFVNDPKKQFYKSDKPKISIIIAIYNAEGYIQNALLSIQNQDFKDIEIIMVDDFSQDNSVALIKELIKKDPRILLFQNTENKGTLFTKTRGVLLSKGKYVMILDQDDMYIQSNALSILYRIIERKKLDILGFSAIIGNFNLTKKNFYNYFKTPILYQPNISRKMYIHKKSGKILRVGGIIWVFIYKSDLFKKIINQIDDKILNTKMIGYEDYILFFLLTRNAYNFYQIKKIFYFKIQWNSSPKIEFSKKQKKENFINAGCQSALNYIEFLLIKTNNNTNDKRIASYELEHYYFNTSCWKNKHFLERGRNVCKLFLANKYIKNDIKYKIFNFLNKTNDNNSPNIHLIKK